MSAWTSIIWAYTLVGCAFVWLLVAAWQDLVQAKKRSTYDVQD